MIKQYSKSALLVLDPVETRTPAVVASPALKPNRMVILAFAAVYLIWGSTYLAIRVGIETLPAWLLVFFRFSLAGSIALGLGHFRREPELTPQARLLALGSGALMILSNGLVAISEASLASGIVAVVVGATPIWLMLLGWLCFGRTRPGIGKLAGALFGLAGVGLIAGGHFQGAGGMGLVALGAANLLWTLGTLMQAGQPKPSGVFRFAGLQMLTGAALAGPIALIQERPWELDFTSISLSSWGALIYLAIFGSLIAFTAYTWLSARVEPHLLSTYALVNPVIAVGLGWLVYREPVTVSFVYAVALVLVGVGLLMKH